MVVEVRPTRGDILARTHYKLLCRVSGADVFLVWYTNDRDGVVVTPDERVLCFGSEGALVEHAQKLHVTLSEHRPVVHDLDAVDAWAQAPTADPLDCRKLLLAWNFFGDVARSTPSHAKAFEQAEAHLDALYDKLFLGTKPTSLPAESNASSAVWSGAEIERLSEVMRRGLELFRTTMIHAG